MVSFGMRRVALNGSRTFAEMVRGVFESFIVSVTFNTACTAGPCTMGKAVGMLVTLNTIRIVVMSKFSLRIERAGIIRVNIGIVAMIAGDAVATFANHV